MSIETLTQLQVLEDNNIASTETAIRNTLNNLFNTFKTQGIKNKPTFKHFSTIHNFFVTITLMDYENLNEISRLTRVNNINNNSEHFIIEVNEVLNEDINSNEDTYLLNSSVDINSDILKYIDDGYNISLLLNVTEENNINKINYYDENLLSDNEYYRPSGRRIYHGIRTRIRSFPFVASVQFFKKFQCAGSIIKSDLIITSASCLQLAWNNRFFRENPAFLSVQVGSNYYEGGGDNIAVLEVYFHPNYNPKTLRNNLAIMRLTRKIIFKKNRRRVKKIDIDRNPWPLPSNTEKITVIGWGAKESDNIIYNPYKNKISYAELNFYPLSDCKDHYSREFVTKENFCAGFYSKGSGACNRDAGGPGIVDDTLVGVISFGSPVCGAPDAPTVFTKLGYYTEWITNIMKQDVPYVRQPITTKIPVTLPNYPSKSITTVATFVPLIFSKKITTPKAIYAKDLRVGQDQDFKDFLSTMFSREEDLQYFDTADAEAKENIDSIQKEDEMNSSNEGITRMDIPVTSKIKLITTTPKHITKTTFRGLKLSSRSVVKNIEFGNEFDTIESATNIKHKGKLRDNDSNDETSLEININNFINNLDSKQFIKLEQPSTHWHSNSNVVKNKDKRKNVIKATRHPTNSNMKISSKDQSVTNSFFLSGENTEISDDDDDDGGLSIEMDSFNDLTMRNRRNNTKTSDVLSELYQLISLAIVEEANRI